MSQAPWLVAHPTVHPQNDTELDTTIIPFHSWVDWGSSGDYPGGGSRIWEEAGKRQAKKEKGEKTVLKTTKQRARIIQHLSLRLCLRLTLGCELTSTAQCVTERIAKGRPRAITGGHTAQQRQALPTWVRWGSERLSKWQSSHICLRATLSTGLWSSACPKGERNLPLLHSKIQRTKVYARTRICPYVHGHVRVECTCRDTFTPICTGVCVCVLTCACLRKLHFPTSEPHVRWARQRQSRSREDILTYGVPHHDVYICAEWIINVLSNVKIDKVTEVVIHVNTWYWRKEIYVN